MLHQQPSDLQSQADQEQPETPDLNPVESLWSTLKAGLGNLAIDSLDHLAAIIRTRLKRIQYRPELIPGFLAQTGLSLEPQPP